MGIPVETSLKEENADPELNIQLDPAILNDLNADITIEEVQRVVLKTKRNKARGIDKIPYGVLKNERLIKTLANLYQMCFKFGIIPQLWVKALIVPIPKNKGDDPRIPLNYQGISLLSCIFKIYTMVLN